MIDNKKVEVLMKEKRYNKTTLSKVLGMADMTLIRKLKGENEWKFDEVWKLTQILDVEMNDLLKKEEV